MTDKAKRAIYNARYRDKQRFGGNRELVIARDNGRCVKCGTTREQHKLLYGRDITVDHIDNHGSNVIIEEKNNSIDNLQTLCFSCHGKKDGQVRSSGLKLTKEDKDDIFMFHNAGIPTSKIRLAYPMVSVAYLQDIVIAKHKENNKTILKNSRAIKAYYVEIKDDEDQIPLAVRFQKAVSLTSLSLNLLVTSSLLIFAHPYFFIVSLLVLPFFARQLSHLLSIRLAIERRKKNDERQK